MEEQERAQVLAQLQTMREELGGIEERMEAVRSQATMVANTLAQLIGAKEAMDRYSSGEGEEEVLVPVGGDAFFSGRIASKERAVVGIGTGVFLEMPTAKASMFYDKRVEEVKGALSQMEQVRGRLAQQHDQIAEQYEALVEALQREMQAAEAGPQPVTLFPPGERKAGKGKKRQKEE